MDTLKFENLYLNIQRVSKANFPLVVEDNLNIWMKDLGEANLTGSAPNSRIELADVAKLYAAGLTLNQTDIQTRDISYAELNIKERLVAQTADGSNVAYQGEPSTRIDQRDASRIWKK